MNRARKTGRTRTIEFVCTFQIPAVLRGPRSSGGFTLYDSDGGACLAVFGPFAVNAKAGYFHYWKAQDDPPYGAYWESVGVEMGQSALHFVPAGTDDPYAPPDWESEGPEGYFTLYAPNLGTTTWATDDPYSRDPTEIAEFGLRSQSKGSGAGTFQVRMDVEEWACVNENGPSGRPTSDPHVPIRTLQFIEVPRNYYASASWCRGNVTTYGDFPTYSEADILGGAYRNGIDYEVDLRLASRIPGSSITATLNGSAISVPQHSVNLTGGPEPTYAVIGNGITINAGTTTGPSVASTPVGIDCIPATTITANTRCLALDTDHGGSIRFQFDDSTAGPPIGTKFWNASPNDAIDIVSNPTGYFTTTRYRYRAGTGDYGYQYPGDLSPLSNSVWRWDSLGASPRSTPGDMAHGGSAYRGFWRLPSYPAFSIGTAPGDTILGSSETLDTASAHSFIWDYSDTPVNAEAFRYLTIPCSADGPGRVRIDIVETCRGAVNETNQVKTWYIDHEGSSALMVDLCSPNVIPPQHYRDLQNPRVQTSRFPLVGYGDVPWYSHGYWGINRIESITATLPSDSGSWTLGPGTLHVSDVKLSAGCSGSSQNSQKIEWAFDFHAVGQGIVANCDGRWGLELPQIVSPTTAPPVPRTFENVVSEATTRGWSGSVVSTDTTTYSYFDEFAYVNGNTVGLSGIQSQLDKGLGYTFVAQPLIDRLWVYPGWSGQMPGLSVPLATVERGERIEGIVLDPRSKHSVADAVVTFSPFGLTATSTALNGEYREPPTYSDLSSATTVSAHGMTDLSVLPICLQRIVVTAYASTPGSNPALYCDQVNRLHRVRMDGAGYIVHESALGAPVSGWTPIVRVSDRDASTSPGIAHGPHDRLYCVYSDSGGSYYKTSDDEGRTWSNENSLSTGSRAMIAVNEVNTQLMGSRQSDGSISITRQRSGEVSPTTFTAHSSSGTIFIEDAGFAICAGHEPAQPWHLACVVQAETDLSHWVSTDDAQTWKRIV